MIRLILATVLLAAGISGCYADAAKEHVTSETTESIAEASDQCETAESQEALGFNKCKKCIEWCMSKGKPFGRCRTVICRSMGRCP
jgi:hypothetical protein